MQVLTRRIDSVDVGRGRCLAVVPLDGARVACFFPSRFPENAITNVPGFAVASITSIGGGLLVEGEAARTQSGRTLPLAGEPVEVPETATEVDLFAGLNSALTLRQVETPETVRDWLTWHATHHGLQAALIVDRGARAADALADALSQAPVEGIERVVIVSFDIPLGRADQGPEQHPFHAPDAPGKDRMEVPACDPDRSAFGEMILYELCRALYLKRAAGVMNIDLSDLVTDGAPTVFEQATLTPSGVLPLMAKRIYPWGVDSAEGIGFADHVCERFDGTMAHPRWCMIPERMPNDAVWRMVRIGGVQAAPKGRVYWRAMALRHPTDKISEIVPKTALVEDARLLRTMSANFGREGQRPPVEELNPQARSGTNRTCIVTTMKNEGPFILEWLAYHRAIGVQDFLVYTNDCTDGTDTMLDLLQAKGLLQHRDNPFKETGLKPQHAALQAAEGEPIITDADWVICMDVDEFINIHVGDGTLSDLYAAVPDANMISLTWRLFGNADVEEFRDDLLLDTYTLCAPQLIRKPHQAWGFKTLTRNTGIFKKLGVHRPKGLKSQLVGHINWVNGSGKPMPESDYRNAWRSTTDTYGYDLVTLNHYALRSAESFLVKRDRGRVNHVDRDQGLNYWFRMNHNAEEDLSIQRMIPALRAEYDRLMADPEIAEQHRKCVAAHRAKIDELRATEKYKAFYAEITGERLRRLSRMLKHFGSNVFMAGPDVIPDEVMNFAGKPDYFFTVPDEDVPG